MKPIGVLLGLLGITVWIFPLLNLQVRWIAMLGDFRPFAAVILILIGGGIILFSND